jgi:hypothetical protein
MSWKPWPPAPANPNPTWKPKYDPHPGRNRHDHHQ